MLGYDWGTPRIHEHETAGSVGRLDHSRLEASLPEQCGLLVPRRSCDRYLFPEEMIGNGRTIHLGGGLDFRQHRLWYIEQRQQLVIPGQLVDVIHQRPRGVRVVRHMQAAAGKLPNQPCIDGAEQQFPVRGPLPRAFDMVEDPFDLGSGEIRIEQQAGLGPE
ncbi:hypothetical protein D3C81_1329950 [compost metagenome]